MRLGIDVSDNQGYIDWKKVKTAGVQYAILRSTRGSGNPDVYDTIKFPRISVKNPHFENGNSPL